MDPIILSMVTDVVGGTAPAADAEKGGVLLTKNLAKVQTRKGSSKLRRTLMPPKKQTGIYLHEALFLLFENDKRISTL